MNIEGEGESTGTRYGKGSERSSALRFWSDDFKSLIVEGSGYWRYIPVDEGTRFFTWYDYRTRFGLAGRLLDRLCFRPLIGWATAWSFDRLRLWLDHGLHPQAALRLAAIHAVCRLAVAFVWLWHGLVPKLLFSHPDERRMLATAGLPEAALPWIGLFEIALAVVAVAFWRWRAFFVYNALAMLAALAAVAVNSPEYLTAAFNPVTLNISMILFSVIGFIAARDLPSASRCLRSPAGTLP